MGFTCAQHEFPRGGRPGDREHPVVAVLAVVAIIAAILLIVWAHLELHGAADISAALSGEAKPMPASKEQRQREAAERARDAAVTSNRFATGLSP